MNIGIDIDGCLADLTEFHWVGMPLFCKRKGIKYDPIALPNSSGKATFNLTTEQFNQFWAEEEAINLYFNKPARIYAKEIIDNLRALGHKIYIITSRHNKLNPFIEKNFKMPLEEFTLKWLEENKINYDEILFKTGKKVEAVNKYHIDYLLEDSEENIFAVANETNCKVFVFDNYSNSLIENTDKIVRVYSMLDFYERLIKDIEKEPIINLEKIASEIAKSSFDKVILNKDSVKNYKEILDICKKYDKKLYFKTDIIPEDENLLKNLDKLILEVNFKNVRMLSKVRKNANTLKSLVNVSIIQSVTSDFEEYICNNYIRFMMEDCKFNEVIFEKKKNDDKASKNYDLLKKDTSKEGVIFIEDFNSAYFV